MGTFDQFCAARLRRIESPPARALTRPEQIKPFVLNAIAHARQASERRHPGEFTLHGTGELDVEFLLRAFERIKGTLVLRQQGEEFRLTPETALDTSFHYTTLAVFNAYESRRLNTGPAGDQDGFRYVGDATYDMACELESDNPSFSYENHPLRLGDLQALFVDEFHDMNRAMATVLKHLMELYPQVPFTGVGDVDQVIHAASGAESYFLRAGFNIEFGAAERMHLTEARRFGRNIADFLGHLTGKPYPSQQGRFCSIQAVQKANARSLALHIEQTLTTLEQEQPKFARSELAILLRHPNSALDLEFLLLQHGIEYVAFGFTPYMARPEVLFVRMLLSAAVGFEDAFTEKSLAAAKLATWEFIGGALQQADLTSDPETESKILKAPVQSFQRNMLENLLARTPRQDEARSIRAAIALAKEDRIDLLGDALEALQIHQLASKVFVNAETVRDATDSVASLIRLLKREQFNSISDLLRVIRNQEENSQFDYPRRKIVLSTIDRAKGLEFEHVIIPGLNHGEFDADHEDERNLFYVAVSRAKHTVELVFEPGRASRFIPSHMVQKSSYSK